MCLIKSVKPGVPIRNILLDINYAMMYNSIVFFYKEKGGRSDDKAIG